MSGGSVGGGGSKLPLVEEFYTLQGEGAHSGTAAWFIRLAGCDVGCEWCDSGESWSARKHPSMDVADIVSRASAQPAKTVVVTGGEPLMHNLDELSGGLHSAGKRINLETSGSHPFSGSFDWVCVSPKRRRPPLDEAWQKADELKVIVETPADFEWAEQCAANVRVASLLFLQPEWNRRAEMTPQIVEYIKQHPRWRLSLQSHKYIGIA